MILRVIKLGLMAAIGYAAYQFIRGILEGEEAIEVKRPAAQRRPSQAGSAVLTGGGSGRVVTTADGDGTSAPHRVGRGVVRR